MNNDNPKKVYADIIDLPHHQSAKRKQMSLYDRAAQFAPFSALSGYDDMVREESRLTDEKEELSEHETELLNRKLGLINDAVDDGYTPEITVICFTPDKLKAGGAKLGVLSNKFDAATRFVIAEQFPGVFDIVWGEGPDVPRKPDPTGLLNMMAELGVEPERVAYIGDSGGDMTVAHAAGCTAIGVTWGYRSVEVLEAAGADMLIDTPSQLYNV